MLRFPGWIQNQGRPWISSTVPGTGSPPFPPSCSKGGPHDKGHFIHLYIQLLRILTLCQLRSLQLHTGFGPPGRLFFFSCCFDIFCCCCFVPFIGFLEQRGSLPLLDVLHVIGGWPAASAHWDITKGTVEPKGNCLAIFEPLEIKIPWGGEALWSRG